MTDSENAAFKKLVDKLRIEYSGRDYLDNLTIGMMRRTFKAGLEYKQEINNKTVHVLPPEFDISDSGRQSIVDDLQKDNG